MIDFPYVSVDKSIESGWLEFNNKPKRFFDIVNFIIYPVFGLIAIFIIYRYNFNPANQNDRAFGFYILPFVIVACFYVIYRKITETKLSRLQTSLPLKRNKILLIDFLTKEGLTIFHESEKLLVAGAEESISINYSRMQVYIFILSEKDILFTMLKIYSKGSPPVFIDHLLLKRDLKKIFTDKYQ